MANFEMKVKEMKETVLKKDPNVFRNILINMTIKPETFFSFNGFDSKEIEKLIPNWKKLRKDLRNSYSAAHPLFKMGTTPIEEFSAELRSASRSDVYLMEFISEKIASYLELHPSDISRAIYLLTADTEAKQFGGLRELGFNYVQAETLYNMPGMTFALANSLSSRFDELKTETSTEPNTQEEEVESERYEEAEEEVVKHFDFGILQPEITAIKQEVEESLTPSRSKITDLILDSSEDVQDFLKFAKKLESKGFSAEDLSKMLANPNKVMELIHASNDFLELLYG